PSPLCYSYADHRDLHSFPTRRSSDLHGRSEVRKRNFALPHKLANVRNRDAQMIREKLQRRNATVSQTVKLLRLQRAVSGDLIKEDRKSTRLNSSHVKISYAVFCLKKK